ncbi:MAG: VIT1/CCC1 transporter family protein [Archaeoglobaceae archaeon]
MIPRDFRTYFEIADVSAVSRRYFVIGFFDGLITIAGLIIGAFISGENDSKLILTIGFATALALGISSMWGAFEIERIEQKVEKKRREKYMLSKLEDSIIEDAHRFATVFTSFIHGIAPILGAIVLIVPYAFLSPLEAFEVAIAICCFSFFILGVVIGKMGGENAVLNGLRMLVFGIVVILVVLIINPGHVI